MGSGAEEQYSISEGVKLRDRKVSDVGTEVMSSVSTLGDQSLCDQHLSDSPDSRDVASLSEEGFEVRGVARVKRDRAW